MKTCFKCKAEKQNSEFHRDRKRKDGLSSSCAECRNASKRVKNPYKGYNGKAPPFIRNQKNVSTHAEESKNDTKPFSVEIEGDDIETVLKAITVRHSAFITLGLNRTGGYIISIHSRPVQKTLRGTDLNAILKQALHA